MTAFYLILNVAVGGTSGWFPDGFGGKPWLDGSLGMCHLYLRYSTPIPPPCTAAMSDFAKKQDDWYSTWPQGESIDDRALVV